MTLEQIVTRIYVGLGEPSDLQIYQFGTTVVDTAGAGWRLLVDVVNQSQLELATWKFPDGHQLRMRINDALTMFQTKSAAATVTDASATNVLEVSGLAAGDNLYKNQLVVGPTGSALVMASSEAAGTTTLYLIKVTGSFANGQAVALRQREYTWNAVTGAVNPVLQTGLPYVATEGRPLEIISVVDADTEATLETVSKDEVYLVIAAQEGIPTLFVKIPNGLRFDAFPAETRSYYVRYMRGPKVLGYDDLAVEPEVPPQMHRALELMGLLWGYRRAQESADAYSVKRDLVDFLRTVRTEYDLQDELTPGQIKFYPEGRN